MEEGGKGGRMDDMIRGGVTLPQLTLPQVASLGVEPDRECDQSPHLGSQNANILRRLSRKRRLSFNPFSRQERKEIFFFSSKNRNRYVWKE